MNQKNLINTPADGYAVRHNNFLERMNNNMKTKVVKAVVNSKSNARQNVYGIFDVMEMLRLNLREGNEFEMFYSRTGRNLWVTTAFGGKHCSMYDGNDDVIPCGIIPKDANTNFIRNRLVLVAIMRCYECKIDKWEAIFPTLEEPSSDDVKTLIEYSDYLTGLREEISSDVSIDDICLRITQTRKRAA